MIHAVLVGSAGSTDPADRAPAALLPIGGDTGGHTVLSRLRAQLHQLGVSRVTVLARPDHTGSVRAAGIDVIGCLDVRDELRALGQLAREPGDRMLLCAADLVVPDSVLRAVIGISAHRDTALVGKLTDGDDSPVHPAIGTQRGRVVQVGPGPTALNAQFRGLVVADRDRISAVVEALLPAVAPQPGPDALTLLLGGMLRDTGLVAAHRVPGLPYRRVTDRASLARLLAELDAVDEEAVRLRHAVKRQDDLFTTYAVSSWSPYLVRWVARHGLTPNGVSWLSVLVAAAAAGAFAHGGRLSLVLGAFGLYVSFVLDCVDGQLARYLHRYGRFGGWLDTVADRGKEYLVYAGLAFGAARSGVGDVWPLAIAAMVLLTVRHMTDTWYGTLQDEAAAIRARTPQPTTQGMTLRLGAVLGQVSDRVQAQRAGAMYWLKRTVPLPIGERWMLTGVLTALFDARVALIGLLSWGGLAAAYTFTGRVLRSRPLKVPVMGTVNLSLHRDDGLVGKLCGPLAAGRVPPLLISALPAGVALLSVLPGPWQPVPSGYFVAAAFLAGWAATFAAGHPHAGPLHWLVPAVLRASEAAVVLLVADHADVPAPLVFSLLAVLALYHYDLTARLERRGSPLVWRRLALGWDGRLAVLAVASLVGLAAEGVAALAAYLIVIFVGSALLGVLVPVGQPSGAPPAPRLPATVPTSPVQTGTSPAAQDTARR